MGLQKPGDAPSRLQIDEKLGAKRSIWLRLDGTVDANTFPQITKYVKGLFQEKYFRIVLDCTAVSYISSGGIGALINIMTEAQASGGNLVLMNLSTDAGRAMTLLGLQEVLPTASDRDEAIGYFS